MRTTVTLDPDTRDLVARLMRDRGLSFKQALNYAVRQGLAPPARPSGSYTRPQPLGPARIDLVKARGLADRLEDEAITRELTEGR